MATPTNLIEGQPHEGLGEIQDLYTVDTPDADLVRMIDRKIYGAGKKYEEFKKEGKINEDYWMRNQLEGTSLRWFNSRIVQNRIYFGVETMVPIITSKPAEPVISVADDEEEDSEISKDFTRALEKVMFDKYHNPDYPQQQIFEVIARHLLLYKIGILKIRWDKDRDDFVVEFVHPHKIIISPDGYYDDDVWVAEYLEWSLEDILNEYPDKEEQIMANLFPGLTPPDSVKKTPVGFWEYWDESGKFMVWKMNDVILQKKVNPCLKWTDGQKFDRAANHFDYPKKPYMFLNSQNLGRHLWDDTTSVTQGLSLQDGINFMQRIIVDTARDQGILVGAQEMIDRDELSKYTGGPEEKLSVKGGDPTRALYRVPPKELKSHVQDNLIHLENALDNVMGTHSTTRGEKSRQPTLGQDIISKEADFGRIDAIVRGMERVAAELYNWELQMMVVKYGKDHFARVLGEKNGAKLYESLKEANRRGIKITVKPGSTLPTDKLSQRQEAIELAKANRIDPITFFERMDFPNPKESAKRLLLWEKDPMRLFPDLVKGLEAENQKRAGEAGRITNGKIQPELSVAAGQVSPPAIGQTAAAAGGTEHTQALLQGVVVPPFEGVTPSPEHVSAELQFMATDEFLRYPEEKQANYASHVLKERQVSQRGGTSYAGSVGA